MKKDVTLAVIVGFVIGAIAAFVIVNLPSLMKKGSTKTTIPATNLTPSPVARITTAPEGFTIQEPKDESIASEKSITIKGKAQPASIIVVDTSIDSIAKAAASDGTFEVPITIGEGGNQISITEYTEKGEGETKTITIFYTTEKI